jgi:hypothetical protein
MALKDRIDILNGLTNLAATVTNLLNLEAPGYIRYIPDDIVRQFTSESTDAGSGVTIGSGRFVYAHKSGRRAQLRDSAEKAALDDANSLHLATALTPACYVENGKAFVKPSGGTVVAVLPTTLNSSSDDTISFLPASLSDAIQTKVAWRLLAYSFYTRAFPYTPPSAPEIEYIPAGFSAMATATFATVPTAPTYTTQAVDAGFATVIDDLMASIPAVPAYATQSINNDFATVLTAVQSALDADDIELSQARLAKALKYIEVLQLSIKDAETTLGANTSKFSADVMKLQKDIEISMQKAALYIQEYSNRIQNQQGVFASNKAKFDADMVALQSNLQALVEKYRLDAQQETSVDMQNQAQKAATELQNYSLSLQRYQQNFNAWLAEKQGQQQMLSNLLQQHEIIMSQFIQPQKAVQKVYKNQPLEAEA